MDRLSCRHGLIEFNLITVESKLKEYYTTCTSVEHYIPIDVKINISVRFDSPVKRPIKMLGIDIEAVFEGYVTIFVIVNI